MSKEQIADKIIDSDGTMAKHWRELVTDWELTLKSATAAEAVYSSPDGGEIVVKPDGHWTVRDDKGKSYSGIGWYELFDGKRG